MRDLHSLTKDEICAYQWKQNFNHWDRRESPDLPLEHTEVTVVFLLDWPKNLFRFFL